MSDDYTPTTADVRFNYQAFEDEHTERGLERRPDGAFGEEFDRWHAAEIAAAIREARAKELRSAEGEIAHLINIGALDGPVEIMEHLLSRARAIEEAGA